MNSYYVGAYLEIRPKAINKYVEEKYCETCTKDQIIDKGSSICGLCGNVLSTRKKISPYNPTLENLIGGCDTLYQLNVELDKVVICVSDLLSPEETISIKGTLELENIDGQKYITAFVNRHFDLIKQLQGNGKVIKAEVKFGIVEYKL